MRISQKYHLAGNCGNLVSPLRSKLILLFVLLIAPPLFARPKISPPAKSVIVAYVFKRDQQIQPGEIAADKLTRINYAFGLIKDGQVVNGNTSDDYNLAALVALKAQNPSLTVLISVGGWLGSDNFSDMALTKQSRHVFIESAAKYIEQHQLDGLDIDWEYPALSGAGNKYRLEDKHNYTLLFKELRKRFNQEEKHLHRRLYLTTAAGASTNFLEHSEMGEVQRYVDTVNLMAYDYYEPTDDTIAGHHAPLFTNPNDPKKISGDRSVREFEQAGVSAAKIVLGVPFYGHVWGEVDATDHGLYRPGKMIPHAYAQYGNILNSMLNHGYTRYWDPAASVPYLYNPDEKIFVSYEDPESLTLKCKYVREHKLGGMMFWDYDGDPTGALLNTIDEGLWNTSASQGETK